MKEICLTKGMITIVDDDDFDMLSKYKWYVTNKKGTFYTQRRHEFPDGTKKTICMHYLIMGREWVDHIDGDPLNNQKSNLRICTPRQNSMNTRSHSDSTSKYKGVSLVGHNKRWRSEIYYNGKTIYLGEFDKETDAAKTYNDKSIELFGEWGKANIISE